MPATKIKGLFDNVQPNPVPTIRATPAPNPAAAFSSASPTTVERGPSSVRKVLWFGLLGAFGCLVGWLLGEGFLWLAMPGSKEATASLATKPTLPPLVRQAAPTPPAPVAAPAALLSRTLPPAPLPPEIPVLTSRMPAAPAPPPPEFAQRLEKAGAKSGDVQITLIWFNRNDLDLHCVDPMKEHIFFGHRRSRSGGELDVDMNVTGESTRPVENIYWPKGRAP